jgi:hypothetical protein
LNLDVRWIHRRVNYGDPRRFSRWIIHSYATYRASGDLWTSASVADRLGLSVGKLELEYPSGRYACVQNFHADRPSRSWGRGRSCNRRRCGSRGWSAGTCASATAAPASANSQGQNGNAKLFHPDKPFLFLLNHSQLPGRAELIRRITNLPAYDVAGTRAPLVRVHPGKGYLRL